MNPHLQCFIIGLAKFESSRKESSALLPLRLQQTNSEGLIRILDKVSKKNRNYVGASALYQV